MCDIVPIENINISNYIYLLQEREFIRTKENVYKIGKTKQEDLKRFSKYPKGSKLLFHIICNDCDKIEKLVIKEFKNNFKQRTEIGTEYFEGDYKMMLNIIYNIFISDINENINIDKKNDMNINKFTLMEFKNYCEKNYIHNINYYNGKFYIVCKDKHLFDIEIVNFNAFEDYCLDKYNDFNENIIDYIINNNTVLVEPSVLRMKINNDIIKIKDTVNIMDVAALIYDEIIHIHNIFNINEIIKKYKNIFNKFKSILYKYCEITYNINDILTDQNIDDLNENIKIFKKYKLNDCLIIWYIGILIRIILYESSGYTFLTCGDSGGNPFYASGFYVNGIKLKYSEIHKIIVNIEIIMDILNKYKISNSGIIYYHDYDHNNDMLLDISTIQEICDLICLNFVSNDFKFNRISSYGYKHIIEKIHSKKYISNGQFILACLLLHIKIDEIKYDSPNILPYILDKKNVISDYMYQTIS